MTTLLTFGDSNTWGALPVEFLGQRRRLDRTKRWNGVAMAALGPGWELIEEGLPGRTTEHEDEVMGRHMDGSLGLPIALQSHGPIDVMTLMLGTNDCKDRLQQSAEDIAASLGKLVDICLDPEMQERHDGFKLLVICPPPVFHVGCLADQFTAAAPKSQALPPLVEAMAAAKGVGFLNAGDHIESSRVDGIHFEEDGHLALGKAVAEALRALV